MGARQHDTKIADSSEQNESVKRAVLKRRGVIAGAAAMIAGTLAAKSAKPVVANRGDNFILGQDNLANPASVLVPTEYTPSPEGEIYFDTKTLLVDASRLPDAINGTPYNVDGIQSIGKGSSSGVVGFGGQSSGAGVFGFGQAAGTGVIGLGGTFGGQGVAGLGKGTSPGVVGVADATSASNGADGMQGFAHGTGVGVVGHGGGGNGTGLLGFGGAANGQGAAGIGNGTGPGLVGVGGNFTATNNADGVQGFANGTGTGVFGIGGGKSGLGIYGAGGGPNGTGIRGHGTGTGTGIIGASSGGYGVVGATGTAGHAALVGVTATANSAALTTVATVPTAYAATFSGKTVVQGDFYVVAGTKSAAVAHPDGSHRLFYCVESPESWFEDFGKAKLVSGKAEVKIDADFATAIHTDDYHVFLTGNDVNSEGLVVSAQRADSFAVEERKSGKSDGTFSWRLVAKRKDIAGKRLEKVDLPQIMVPDVASLLAPLIPPGPPAVTVRAEPQLPRNPELPVVPNGGKANPSPKKP